jgi:hypothetical protein
MTAVNTRDCGSARRSGARQPPGARPRHEPPPAAHAPEAAAELAETQRLLLEGRRANAALLAELRTSVDRIESMLKEVG